MKNCRPAQYQPVSGSLLMNWQLLILKDIQKASFPEEVESFNKELTLLLSLGPFLYENGIIRVKGRIKNSDLACH